MLSQRKQCDMRIIKKTFSLRVTSFSMQLDMRKLGKASSVDVNTLRGYRIEIATCKRLKSCESKCIHYLHKEKVTGNKTVASRGTRRYPLPHSALMGTLALIDRYRTEMYLRDARLR